MGISMAMIETLKGLGLFGQEQISVLDVGSSNLYTATADGIKRFLTSYDVIDSPELDAFIEKLAKGSEYDAEFGGTNGAFVGELLEKAGMTYHAIDIADGYGTTILDLNHESAPKQFVGAFDLVLNFGTTEHLLNQYNAFKVIHDSTKLGGYMVHSLPCVGFSNHGYFTYTPRCMFDLAGYNEYEVVGFWFEGPVGSNDLYSPVKDYLSYFPNLAKTLRDREQTESGQRINNINLPDVALMIIYRKVKQRPFAGALERSTSVGLVPNSVTSTYEATLGKILSRNFVSDQQGRRFPWAPKWLRWLARNVRSLLQRRRVDLVMSSSLGANPLSRHDEILLVGEAFDLREQFVKGLLSHEQCLMFYHLVVNQHGSFPYDWEFQILKMGLELEPDRRDLAARLEFVKTQRNNW